MKDSVDVLSNDEATTQDGDIVIDFGGETLVLLPERGVWWPNERSLFIADTHFGKDACFRAAGIPIPSVFDADLARLSRAIERTCTRRLVILGDLLHARDGRSAQVVDEVAQWRGQLPNVEFTLVRGNHDRHAGDPPRDWQIECIEAPMLFKGVNLVHVPTFQESTPTLAGHLHPKVRLEHGADHLRLPCFLRRENTLVLPAFSSFVDHGIIASMPGDTVYVVADAHVVRI